MQKKADLSLFLHLRIVSIYHSWLNSSVEIVKRYTGDQPFSGWLKQWFSRQKKFGSRDRRQIGTLCYRYYRMGKWAQTNLGDIGEKILVAQLLCDNEETPLLAALKPEWLVAVSATADEKIHFLQKQGIDITISAIFPWTAQLSEAVKSERFASSILVQPHLFIRIRPGYADVVHARLQHSETKFTVLGGNCIALPNTTNVLNLFTVDKEVVIQDYNSQNISLFLQEITTNAPNIWDCCAASGGKSILAVDTLRNPRLTVSDIRPSILANLNKRFAEAGIRRYHAFQLDLEQRPQRVDNAPFDLIICDAPCTGSGTWGRTPEQLYFFKEKEIARFHQLQRKIAGNASVFLKPGGHFLYITCSVFREENENVVRYLQEQHGLELLKMECLKGYDKQADTMFGALFVKG